MNKMTTSVILGLAIIVILYLANDIKWTYVLAIIVLVLLASLWTIVFNYVLLFVLLYVTLLHGITAIARVQAIFKGGKTR